jgi:cell wall-associated NlpC family hydrolase
MRQEAAAREGVSGVRVIGDCPAPDARWHGDSLRKRSAALAVALSIACAVTLASGYTATVAQAATQGEAIVAAAASQAGRPYCWDGGNTSGPTHGGGGPGCEGSTVGFDCTGLTLYAVYQATGKVLTHDGHQATEGGQIIHNESELQPGDLVFFGGTLSSFEHAGVYAGGGKIWDALNYGIPVQEHTLTQVGLPFVGGARYWSGSTGAPGEGSFVSHSGYVYRIAGGAPIYVSNWAAVGGPYSATPLSDTEFAALPRYPRDGTILDGSDGRVYITAGGAPLYVSNWNAIGGPKQGVGIDAAAVGNAGGGVPWDHLRAYPADGTILDASDTRVYITAGGAPLYVSNWNAIGGPKQGVGIDRWDVENTSDSHAHLRAYPADGTFVATSGDGRVYEIAGGAPLYVSNWSAVGGPKAAVGIDQWDVNNTGDTHAHLRQYPADGTFINTSTGRVYRIAGGAPFYISTWSIFGGVQHYVNIDQWDISSTSDPHAHLRASPLDGTVVKGLPSNQYWSFSSGLRSPTVETVQAIAVDDAGLAAFQIEPVPPTTSSPHHRKHRHRHPRRHRHRHHKHRPGHHHRSRGHGHHRHHSHGTHHHQNERRRRSPGRVNCPSFTIDANSTAYIWSSIRTHRTSCHQAQRILTAFFSGSAVKLPNAASGYKVLGWRCHTGPAVPDPAGTPVACTRKTRKIRAKWR